MSVILYTTHCPVCKLLERKLNDKKVDYETCEDVDTLIAKGFTSVPVLEVDGKELKAKEALKWVEEQK